MLYRFSLLLLFGDLAHVDADPRDRGSRIINGVEVTNPFKYDYIAKVNNCGASLVAPNVLLSAAHCTSYGSITMNKLKFDKDTRQTRESFAVIQELIHPDYKNQDNQPYDFKLIRINGFSQNTPVLLDDGSNDSEGTELTVMGWGLTADGGTHSDRLMEVDVDVSNFATCKSNYDQVYTNKLDSAFHICAGKTVGDETYDSCNGDSGGPLIKYNADGQDTLVGVVSFGKGCGKPTYPGVYGRVSAVKAWVEEWIAEWDCKPPGGRRRRRLKKGKPAKKPKGKTPTKAPTGGKKGKPTPSPVVGGNTCPPAKDGCEWKEVCGPEEPDDPCGFVLDDDKIKVAVALYRANPTAAVKTYGEVPFWYTADVTNFNMLFMNHNNFNADVSGWDTSKATDMSMMFQGADAFNQPIGKWKTDKVTDMNAMFEEATKFNQDVSMWDVAKVVGSASMFNEANTFNQDMCPWVNSDNFLKDVDQNMLKNSACEKTDKPTDLVFCHDCIACATHSDCPARTCGVGTCGLRKVCQYTLGRQNVLRIKLVTGTMPEDVSFELKENGKLVTFAKHLNGAMYEWDVDVCQGPHTMCVKDDDSKGNASGGHEVYVTYMYTKKSVDTTNFPIKMDGSTKDKCQTFTVDKWE